MDYQINHQGDAARVVFSGDITFSENPRFRAMLEELVELNLASCVMDLSSVPLIDSAGLGMFLIAKEKSENAGFKLKVEGAQGHVASMLKLTKLSDLLDS